MKRYSQHPAFLMGAGEGGFCHLLPSASPSPPRRWASLGEMSGAGPLSQVTSKHRGAPILCLYDPGRNFWSCPSRLESSSHGNKWSVPLSKIPASPTTCTPLPSSARMVRWSHGLYHPQLWDSWVALSHVSIWGPCSKPMFTGSER